MSGPHEAERHVFFGGVDFLPLSDIQRQTETVLVSFMRRLIFAFLASLMAVPASAEAVSGDLSAMIRKEEVTLAKLSSDRVNALFRRVGRGGGGPGVKIRGFLPSLSLFYIFQPP